MQHVLWGCCKQFPTKASGKHLLAPAVLLRHSTGPAPGFRSTHKLLGSLPFSTKEMALVAHRGGPVRQAHPLRTECRKRMLFLNSAEESTVFRRTPAKLSQSAFWKFLPPAGQETPPFQLKLLTGCLPNIWHLYAIFVPTCCPKEKPSIYQSNDETLSEKPPMKRRC